LYLTSTNTLILFDVSIGIGIWELGTRNSSAENETRAEEGRRLLMLILSSARKYISHLPIYYAGGKGEEGLELKMQSK
jgi:hypothetical protein